MFKIHIIIVIGIFHQIILQKIVEDIFKHTKKDMIKETHSIKSEFNQTIIHPMQIIITNLCFNNKKLII
jgi:hypothetical protein